MRRCHWHTRIGQWTGIGGQGTAGQGVGVRFGIAIDATKCLEAPDFLPVGRFVIADAVSAVADYIQRIAGDAQPLLHFHLCRFISQADDQCLAGRRQRNDVIQAEQPPKAAVSANATNRRDMIFLRITILLRQ